MTTRNRLRTIFDWSMVLVMGLTFASIAGLVFRSVDAFMVSLEIGSVLGMLACARP